ncbi:MAG: FAD-binding oxidoreductase [Promethearchaeota archaeon]
MLDESIIKKLQDIVGPEFASNKPEDLYIYGIDPGASLPRKVDFVVLPKTLEEVQNIVKFANEKKIPIVPMGGGLTLSGLTLPVRGGIVIDLKRMDRILEINEKSRYALIEPGVTTGQLKAYLEQHYPELENSMPDAPPSVTVAGNALIHGSGYLSQKYGDHGEMINGLEVVLPNGELCKLGSCAVSEYWFARGPIPDMIGLFISSFGTLGIITKLSYKLYPKSKLRTCVFGLTKDPNVIPGLLQSVTKLDIIEDVLLGVQDKPEWMRGYVVLITYITGNEQAEIDDKIKILKKVYRKKGARYMKVPDRYYNIFLEKPQFAAKAADFRKGGGFEYVGAMLPLEKIPQIIAKGHEISNNHGIVPTMGARIIGKAHNIMFFISYSFNRADPNDIANARHALHETNVEVLKLGGIPWKPELKAQKMIMKKMDPNYLKLFQSIRKLLDPNNIMNPGNWEVEN